MKMWRWRSLTTAWASPTSVTQAWVSPRCRSERANWEEVASSSLPHRAAPACSSIYRYPRRALWRALRSSEKDGDSTHPSCRRPSSFQEGYGLPALLGARVRGGRRGNNRGRGRSACRTAAAGCGLDGPANARGERHRGHTEDPPGEPEQARPGGNALRGRRLG